MYQRATLKAQAKKALGRNYWKSVLTGLLLAVLTGGAATPTVNVTVNSGRVEASAKWLNHIDFELLAILAVTMLGFLLLAIIVVFLLRALLLNPLMVGARRFALINAHQPAALDELGSGFGANYKNNVKTMFLMDIYVLLWTLLLFVPGIVAAYRYRMVPYLLAEHPEMSTQEVLQRSKDMMVGQKLNAFVLDLSFLGWNILSGLTFGLAGVFFVAPYKMQTDANLYLALSRGNSYAAQ